MAYCWRHAYAVQLAIGEHGSLGEVTVKPAVSRTEPSYPYRRRADTPARWQRISGFGVGANDGRQLSAPSPNGDAEIPVLPELL